MKWWNRKLVFHLQGASPDVETRLRMVSLSWLGSVKQDDNWKETAILKLSKYKIRERTRFLIQSHDNGQHFFFLPIPITLSVFRYHRDHFLEMYCEQHDMVITCFEDGGSNLIWEVRNNLSVDILSHCTILEPSSAPLWEPQNLKCYIVNLHLRE